MRFELASYRHSGSHSDTAAALCRFAEDATTRFFFYRGGEHVPADDGSLPPQLHPEEGDALLICTENLWAYLPETEIRVDLLKAGSAEDWLRYLLVRLAGKTRLATDDFAALCGIWKKDEETRSP